MRRLEIVGPAGSGKSLLAAEKARAQPKAIGHLLVCFNQRLATTIGRELEHAMAPAGPTVTTFHRLSERLGTDAGVLPSRPSPIPQDWWDETLPRALDAAIDADPDTRFHAIIIDEGQDFRPRLARVARAPADRPGWCVLGLPRSGPGPQAARGRRGARPTAVRSVRGPSQPTRPRPSRDPVPT
jgi:hypothetical protein